MRKLGLGAVWDGRRQMRVVNVIFDVMVAFALVAGGMNRLRERNGRAALMAFALALCAMVLAIWNGVSG